jgi:hypothetical protein
LASDADKAKKTAEAFFLLQKVVLDWRSEQIVERLKIKHFVVLIYPLAKNR